ncbi:MAG: hypothetical protein U0987_20860 [Afipia sp.]|nr:hypothetical protein [Afipia sp.]
MSVFDVQAETKAPTRIEFRGNESRGEAFFYLGFGGFLVTLFVSKGGWTAIIGGTIFGSLFLLLAFGKAFGELDRSVYLAFDAEGLSVPTLFGQTLPWSAITGFAFETGTEGGFYLYVEVTEPRSYGPKSRLSLITWPVFSHGFRLGLDSIACNEKAVEAAFRRFAPGARKV